MWISCENSPNLTDPVAPADTAARVENAPVANV
jgi:hypothetical protein